MKDIVIDENGNAIDYLEERNKQIEKNLAPVVEGLIKERNANNFLRKPMPIRFGYRFSVMIEKELRQFGLMSAEEVVKLDYDTIEHIFYKYLDLLAWANSYFDVSSTKQFFCAFARINNRIFNQLEKSDDSDIRDLIQFINDSINGLGFSSAESGNFDSKSVLSRMKIRDAGQGMVENAYESNINISAINDTPKQLDSEINKILGISAKK